MSRALVSLVVVCAFAVAAQAAIVTTISAVGSYTATYGGTSTNVDVYKVHMDAGTGRLLGSLVIDVGATAADPNDPNDPNTYDDPFQVGYRYKVLTTWYDYPTPTEDDLGPIGLDPNDPNYLYHCDSRFLPPGSGGWTPAVDAPQETANDKSIYYAGATTEDLYLGKSSLLSAIAIPTSDRLQAMDVLMIGVIDGTTVYLKTGCADDLGMTTKETLLIPEPATLTLIGLGALCLIRRRR